MKFHLLIVLLNLSVFPLLVFAELFVDTSENMIISIPETQSKNRATVGPFSRSTKSSQNDNLFHFVFSTNGPPTIRAGYAARNTSGSAPSSGFQMSFLRLVEYNDTVPFRRSPSEYQLSGRNQWTQIDSKSSHPNSSSRTWTYTTTLKDSRSNMTLHLVICRPIFLKQDNKSVSNLKYSLTIENYPFQLKQGRLAVIKALHTTSALLGPDSDGKLISEKFEKFGWSQSTDVNDESLASTASTSADLITEPTYGEEREGIMDEHVSHFLFRIDAITPRKVRWTSDMFYAMGLPKWDKSADVSQAHPSNSFLPLALVIITACVLF